MDKGLRRFPFRERMGAHPHRYHQVGLEVLTPPLVVTGSGALC